MAYKDPEKAKAYIKEWNKRNKDKRKSYIDKYRRTHKEKLKERRKNSIRIKMYEEGRKEEKKIYAREYRKIKKEIIKKKQKERYLKTKNKISEYNKIKRQENLEEIRRKDREKSKTPHGRYNTTKQSAKQRNIPFELTFEEFMTFWQQPCYYTGVPIETVGIDRVDNSKGYILGNCVPCDIRINKMKRNREEKFFLNHCCKIANRFSFENYKIFDIKGNKIKGKFNQSFNARFNSYKQGAKYRGIEFKLTKKDFKKHWQKDCHYCGDNIDTIGLDRVDSAKGYSMDNVVDCCETCNRMKADMGKQEFIDLCVKIGFKFGIKEIKINSEKGEMK